MATRLEPALSTFTPSGFRVAAITSHRLRAIAVALRPKLRELGCFINGSNVIDASWLLENVLYRAGYDYHVLPKHDLPGAVAFTIPADHVIVIREDVYDRIEAGTAFSRSTVLHEFAHIFLGHSVTLHRHGTAGAHRWIEDSEWQANNFTVELLMPIDVVEAHNCDPRALVVECGVSLEAATLRVKKLRERGLIKGG